MYIGSFLKALCTPRKIWCSIYFLLNPLGRHGLYRRGGEHVFHLCLPLALGRSVCALQRAGKAAAAQRADGVDIRDLRRSACRGARGEREDKRKGKALLQGDGGDQRLCRGSPHRYHHARHSALFARTDKGSARARVRTYLGRGFRSGSWHKRVQHHFDVVHGRGERGRLALCLDLVHGVRKLQRKSRLRRRSRSSIIFG